MTPSNGIQHYSDERVLLALARLTTSQGATLTQADIAAAALVSLRTVHTSLDRLIDSGLIVSNDRQQGRPATYTLSDKARAIVEERNASIPCP